MKITCTICSDLFVAADTLVGTNCGHVFHHQCLLQWLERSKSCPQCRAKSNEKSIYRIYFNIYNGPNEDFNAQQNKIDSLEFKLLLKDTELKKCHEQMQSHKKKEDLFKDEVKKLKSDIKSSEVSITCLKEQFSILKRRNKELEPIMEECERLRRELQFLRNVDTVVKGTSDEVEEMLKDYGVSLDSTKSLLAFTSVLKKEMGTLNSKKKELNFRLRETEKKVFKLSSQVRELRDELSAQTEQKQQLLEELRAGAEERSGLQHKLRAAEEALASPSGSAGASALKRLLAESPAPSGLKRSCLSTPEPAPGPSSAPAQKKEDSPYLNIKSSSFGLTPLRPIHSNSGRSMMSIFKKPRINTLTSNVLPEEAYDGMGGHSKADFFPQPLPKFKIPKRMNKPLPISKIKLKDASASLKMDNFLNK